MSTAQLIAAVLTLLLAATLAAGYCALLSAAAGG